MISELSAMRWLLFICLFGMLGFTPVKQSSTENETLMKVFVSDYAESPKAREKIIFISKATGKKYSGVSNEAGEFKLLLPEGATYRILVDYVGVKISYTEITLEDKPGIATPIRLNVQFEIKTSTIVLRNVHFDTGQATMKTSSFRALRDLVDAMKRKTTMVVEIAGHTDDVGADIDNLRLSQKRAEAVQSYLFRLGIPRNRVIAKGYGETEPVAKNDSNTNRAKNRRTEVRIIQQ